MRNVPFFTVVDWLPKVKRQDLLGDFMAGLTVAVMLVPQGMAYAMLAGLPLNYGLYAGLVPLFVYPLFGTSPRLSVGPVALVSILVLAGLSELAVPESQRFIDLAILTGILAGVIQILLGLLRLGFLVKFLSHAVLSGFTSAAALIISVSQLKHWLALDVKGSNSFFQSLSQLAEKLGQSHWPSVLLGLIAFIILIIFKRWRPRWPMQIVVLALVTILSAYFVWDQQGIAIVGFVPEGLPAFQIPRWSWADIKLVLPLSLAICLISFIESLAIAKALEVKSPGQRVRPNQELLALGFSKFMGAFFLSYPTTGSFSRSAVNDSAGARSPLSSIFSSIFIALTLLFFTPYFFYLPKAILASIVLASVLGLINWKEAKTYWKTGKRDFTTLVVTFLVTLIAGIQIGIFVGVLLSLAFVIYRSSQPHFPVLGRIPDTRRFRNLTRFPDARPVDGLLILRFDAPLYFGNVDFFRDRIEYWIESYEGQLDAIILDASPIYDIDNSGFDTIKSIHRFLTSKDIRFIICRATGPLRDKLFKANLMEIIGLENQFLEIQDAVDYFEDKGDGWSDLAIQTDINKE